MPTVEQHRHSAAAIGEEEFYRFPSDQLVDCIRSSPKLMNLLIDFATRQLNLAQDQLVMLGTGSADRRRGMASLSSTRCACAPQSERRSRHRPVRYRRFRRA